MRSRHIWWRWNQKNLLKLLDETAVWGVLILANIRDRNRDFGLEGGLERVPVCEQKIYAITNSLNVCLCIVPFSPKQGLKGRRHMPFKFLSSVSSNRCSFPNGFDVHTSLPVHISEEWNCYPSTYFYIRNTQNLPNMKFPVFNLFYHMSLPGKPESGCIPNFFYCSCFYRLGTGQHITLFGFKCAATAELLFRS